MQEDQTMNLEQTNPITYYFDRVKSIELHPVYFEFFEPGTIEFYSHELDKAYSVFYDKFMRSDYTAEVKGHIEEWYSIASTLISLDRDWLCFADPVGINRELEQILGRADLL